jgi:hypothetical protein
VRRGANTFAHQPKTPFSPAFAGLSSYPLLRRVNDGTTG